MILVPKNGLLPVTRTWLEQAGLERVSVVGGTPSVSATAYDQVSSWSKATMKRYSGSDRYETNRMLASVADIQVPRHVFLASGQNFPDALAAAAAAPKMGPLLLTPNSCIQSRTFDMIETYSPDRLQVLGSTDTLLKAVSNLGTCS